MILTDPWGPDVPISLQGVVSIEAIEKQGFLMRDEKIRRHCIQIDIQFVYFQESGQMLSPRDNSKALIMKLFCSKGAPQGP